MKAESRFTTWVAWPCGSHAVHRTILASSATGARTDQPMVDGQPTTAPAIEATAARERVVVGNASVCGQNGAGLVEAVQDRLTVSA